MWVISVKRLRQFWAAHPRAEAPLRRWAKRMRVARLATPADLAAAFPDADPVGNCTVFDIGGNKYRLVARLAYPSHKVYVLRVMTHAEYTRQPWADDCGCHEPEPE